jgi:hypothetical protein
MKYARPIGIVLFAIVCTTAKLSMQASEKERGICPLLVDATRLAEGNIADTDF